MKNELGLLTDAQLQAELDRCEFCEEKPCQTACPADCSPADFIMAAKLGGPQDYRRAGALIMGSNPLGWVCGVVCPDTFCMSACSRKKLDAPLNIPAIQATVMKKAYDAGLRSFGAPPPGATPKPEAKHRTVAVVGGGPAGLGAASVLAQKGYRVTVFEAQERLGGMMNLIPDFRLDKRAVRRDLEFVRGLGDIRFVTRQRVERPEALLNSHSAVIVCVGLEEPILPDVPGGERAVAWQAFLASRKMALKGKSVAVLGGGAVAVDCAVTARRRGAAQVEMIYRRKTENMPLTGYERGMLLEHGVEVSTCSKVLAVLHTKGRVTGLRLARLSLPAGKEPRPENFVVNRNEPPQVRRFDVVVSAIGSRPGLPIRKTRGIFYAGDMLLGSATVVESVATGKNAAFEADRWLRGEKPTRFANRAKSRVGLAGLSLRPVPLDAEFFGRRLLSPFLLSAAPHTDGLAQMRKAFERGWAGGVMKTAFDNVAIHIPADYMSVLGAGTYGNCDNVSGHSLDRVCREVERLVREYPDRLTLASTGGPVTGRDEPDRAVWQSNTRKLESCGAMGVEYSLSCPQGGDGTHGDMVSQNAELTAKVIDWVMEASAPDNPKLFKLSGAVTAIRPIISRILDVFARYPDKKAGVTLANSFPALVFRKSGQTPGRDEGVIIGMSGEGVLAISNLTLARVAGLGITVSGNGGAMNYLAAANFLALGARTVQFCTAVMKYGLGIVDELHAGLSFLLEERGFKSVGELIGSALPNPITPFDSLTALKRLPAVEPALCLHCGNCTRCPYQAITLNRRRVPVFDPALCVGCSLCAQKCFALAIAMRPRTDRERAAFAAREALDA
jgi:NADPH-dependent glutamate synthase beta subunit-like oxidoreductase/dihydroorotate dehydrogenase/Pyruvate/2-oxoacid:ferredoxin oxidoreductase delta subunit